MRRLLLPDYPVLFAALREVDGWAGAATPRSHTSTCPSASPSITCTWLSRPTHLPWSGQPTAGYTIAMISVHTTGELTRECRSGSAFDSPAHGLDSIVRGPIPAKGRLDARFHVVHVDPFAATRKGTDRARVPLQLYPYIVKRTSSTDGVSIISPSTHVGRRNPFNLRHLSTRPLSTPRRSTDSPVSGSAPRY
jgi:hypothetical protein